MRRWLPLLLVVWLLGVAGLWRGLPPAPRHELRMPDAAHCAWVTPDGVAIFADAKNGGGMFGIRFSGPLEAWDIATGRRLWTNYGSDDELSVGLAGDGTRVRCWREPDDAPVTRIAATGERVTPDDERFDGRRVVFQGDRAVLVATDRDGRFDLYERINGRRLGRLPADDGVAVRRSFGQFGGDDGVAVSTDGRRAVMAVQEPQELHVYDLETAALLARLPRGERETPRALLTGGEAVLSDRAVRLTRTGQTVLALPDGSNDYFVLPADDRWVVVCHDGPDGAWLRWYDALTGREAEGRRFTLAAERARTHVRCPLPTGNRLYKPCGQDGRWLWCEAARSRPAGSVARFLGRVPGLDFLADNVDLGRCWLLDGSTGAAVVELSGSGYEFLAATDGGRLYTQRDRLVQVWEPTPRPSVRLFAALAVGWAAALVAGRLVGRGVGLWGNRLVEPGA